MESRRSSASRPISPVRAYLAGVVGLALLFYAGYITSQSRKSGVTSGSPLGVVPIEAFVELLLGLVLCFFAAMKVPGKLQPVTLDSYHNRLVELPVSFDFITFNHRGKVNPLDLEVKFKSKA